MKKTILLAPACLCILSFFLVGPESGRSSLRLSSDPWILSFSPQGALLMVEKKGAAELKAKGPEKSGEIFLGEKSFPLVGPASTEMLQDGLRFTYAPTSDPPVRVEVTWRIRQKLPLTILEREIVLSSPAKPGSDLTVRMPLEPFKLPRDTFLPLKNGVGVSEFWGKAFYLFAGAPVSDGSSLAMPMVSFEAQNLSGRATIVTDPYYSTLFKEASVEWTYPRGVGLENGRETRTLSIVLHEGKDDDSLGAFFSAALPDVPPGPSWLHGIAMVGYDYLSDGGRGWFKDIDALEAAIPERDRAQALLCLHGWYDFVGRYSYDTKMARLDSSWTAFSNYPNVKDKFPNSVPVKLTLSKMHERIRYAKSRGFRVALYFGDGMSAGDGLADIYSPRQVLSWGGWQGPDTKGKTYCQNPLAPEVRSFFLDYLAALLREYGQELDALVWDETFHVDAGSLGSEAFPGYADRGMMRLVKELTAGVHEYNRRSGTAVAFLASDCIGVYDWVNKPPYALVADGTYQDTHCDPAAWSYGIFPNFRNVLWSCNWNPVTHWDYTEFGVRNYQAAVAISNGWGDDCGFAEMSPEMRQKVVELFNWRKAFPAKLRWFEKLPVYQETAAELRRSKIRVESQRKIPAITFLSWDTAGGERAKINLLRRDSSVELLFRLGSEWQAGKLKKGRLEGQTMRYELTAGKARLTWDIESDGHHLEMRVSAARGSVEAARLLFPFDPGVTPTTVLPSVWQEDGSLRLPAIINAPDFGGLHVREGKGRDVHGRLEGSREKKTVDLILELPPITEAAPVSLYFLPQGVFPPEGYKNKALWLKAWPGWLNAFQPCARWGEQDRPFSAPPGILGNNVISDPASVSLWFYADQAFWRPEITPGISLAPLVSRTIDYWLEKRMRRDEKGSPTGEITGYWDYGNFLDANASPLIAAWDYVESTGDLAWLEKRVEKLELVADFLARRDVDRDGLVEATQSGNRGALVQPNRSCSWWDALNCGHKDGYTNALIYRAWRCLADLEAKMGRKAEQASYAKLASRLKAAYVRTLFNPKTGWLAWWKSQDGELHDYASPTLNGLAIEYELVEPELGRQILDRLWKKMEEVAFTRFDLGVPPMLVPVRRSDYLQPDAIGIPQGEDGTDTFGQYMNGGITAGHVLHFLAAHYVLGELERADKVLEAMLERQMRGEFQNGVRDAGGQGIDWTTWDGKPSGYEGYLADSFRFLQAVLLREKAFRDKLYRPLSPSFPKS